MPEQEKSLDEVELERARRFLSQRAEYYAVRRAEGFVAIEVIIMDMVALGHLERRPFDESSLAAAMEMPRTTIISYVRKLARIGWIQKRRRGRRSLLFIQETRLESFLRPICRAFSTN